MTSLRVVSFNVRYAGIDEGEASWERRRSAVVDVVRTLRPDVLALQEVWLEQLEDLRERLPGFGWAAERAASGEHTPVGYRRERLLLDGATAFALSETPADLGSVGWDARYPRIATVADLADSETGRSLTVCNAHFDHEGERARAESAALVRARLANGPAVVAGDLNCTPDSRPYRRLTRPGDDGFDDPATALEPFGPAGTYVGFDDEADPRRFDYVFARGVAVDDYGVGPARSTAGRVASDHRPVVADLGLSTESSS